VGLFYFKKYTANALLLLFDKNTIFEDEFIDFNSLNKNIISKRELEILHLYSKGLTYNHIADQLDISPSTVRKHIENISKIYRKYLQKIKSSQ